MIVQYPDISDIKSLVDKFVSKTLPEEKWTHFAHLTVGLWFISNYGLQETSVLMPAYIADYNESLGKENTDFSGYHETITQFWIWLLDRYWKQVKEEKTLLHAVNDLTNSPYGDPSNFLKFYSRELIFSVEARRKFLKPDIHHFDFQLIL
ncbi:hypothetical protein [Dyadobacter frigoris]|uniref:Uncharacterized protein n=1 Tax=Dyadobacter frigoris TaxID=2576211 RepID=A0A4U6CTA7_9BACT|nr:hypothetical protein [Dyadobacter frigoris]TKT86915.1 hypothetical protein FDK13_31195 [Dyadobacter frigoris]GLU56581.1 hypothetical protein Dfri01_60420 [Dyadobacter frigoris]